MWRFVITAGLLVLLVVLVADMLFGDARSLATVDRHPTPPVWSGGAERGALPVGHRPALDAPRVAVADSGEPYLSPAGSGLAGSGLTGRDIASLGPAVPDLPGAGDPDALPGRLPRTTAIAPPAGIVDEERAGTPPPDERQSASVAHAATAPPRAQVAEVQRLLADLGYNPGPADGRTGKRTDAAVREFQADARQSVTGRIDKDLLAALGNETRMRAQMRQQELEVMSPGPSPRPETSDANRGVFGSLLGGMQRLMGRDFDSVRRPDELAAYCRENAETWIYDFGREGFLYCGNVRAGQTAMSNAEAAGTR